MLNIGKVSRIANQRSKHEQRKHVIKAEGNKNKRTKSDTNLRGSGRIERGLKARFRL